TQSLAYRNIRKQKARVYEGRKRTKTNLRRVQDEVCSKYNIMPLISKVWKGLCHKDLSRECKYFYWMTMHDAYMVGSNWQRSNYKPEFQMRALCRKCGVLEDMDYILTGCKHNGQDKIWKLTAKLCRKKGIAWKKPSFGVIL
ncbi:hypothetical protein L218DRAFT_830286, partial [Marasmius fiardii PR-910]